MARKFKAMPNIPYCKQDSAGGRDNALQRKSAEDKSSTLALRAARFTLGRRWPPRSPPGESPVPVRASRSRFGLPQRSVLSAWDWCHSRCTRSTQGGAACPGSSQTSLWGGTSTPQCPPLSPSSPATSHPATPKPVPKVNNFLLLLTSQSTWCPASGQAVVNSTFRSQHVLGWQLSSRKHFPALTCVHHTGTILSPVVARITQHL